MLGRKILKGGDDIESVKSSGGGNMPLLILLGITSVIAIKCIMDHSKNENKILDRLHYGKLMEKVPKGNLLPSKFNKGYEYSFDFWLYIDNITYKYNEEKVILNWKGNMKITIKKKEPTLKVEIYTINGNSEELLYYNLPVQRWLFITVIVKNKYLDLLINGKLYQTKLMENVPQYEISSAHICPNGGFSGYLNKLEYYPKAIGVKYIKQKFAFGPTNSTLLDLFNPTKPVKCKPKIN